MAGRSVPLSCNVCPKKPNFSDVSHLLTHIASKGHLSNYYKVKVRSANDEAAHDAVETYDRWYIDWNVEGLMAERMSTKDDKRARAKQSGTFWPCRRGQYSRTKLQLHLKSSGKFNGTI